MTHVTTDTTFVWGCDPAVKSLGRLPEGVTRYKIRMRNTDYARCVLRFGPNRVEEWIIGKRNGTWGPELFRGANVRGEKVTKDNRDEACDETGNVCCRMQEAGA